jgi:catechol 2,3-dioxygenase-like lactoylglutathione lyase family enzyme
MLDHVTIGVTDLKKSVAFYDSVFGAIGIAQLYAFEERFVGYGTKGKAFFWIGAREAPLTGAHIAFAVDSRLLVDTFHRTGLLAGGRDHGAPGLRPHYHANYYGAFLLDPDGHNIEAVCHAPG